MCISIPQKYAVSGVIGYIKGKSSLSVSRQYGNKNKISTGEKL